MSFNHNACRGKETGTPRKTPLAISLALCLGSIAPSALAALPSNASLNFDTGVISCLIGGTAPNSCTYGATDITTGSYFAMDNNGDGSVAGTEKTVLTPAPTPTSGITLGITQAASGSHSGTINSTESPAFDIWEFFGNTGMDFTRVPITALTDDGAGNVTLDLSGWTVTWNGIPVIDMGGGIQDCGTTSDGICVKGSTDIGNLGGVPYDNGTGIATMTCGTDCTNGDTFTLDYAATVPQADPSGFGGVSYSLHLTGTVSVPGNPPNTLDDSAATITDNPVSIDVLANDTAADGLDPATVTVVSGATNGSTSINTTTGAITYTPGAGFTGTDSFQYTVKSTPGIVSAAATVNISVQTNVAPVANDDTASISTAVLDNTPLVINVLANDTDANNTVGLLGGIDPATVSIVTDATTGTCTANANGTITYTQAGASIGVVDTCTYTASDIDATGALTSNTATITITVTATTSDWPTTLPANTIPILAFDAGVPGDPVDKSIPATSGSYFTMEVQPGTLIYTVMAPGPDGGIVVGYEQPAGNSHTGFPNGTEETSVDQPWDFFSNTGLQFTKNCGIIGNSDGTLQFRGTGGPGNYSQGRWIVSWNGIPEIDLGGDKTGTFPQDLGFATIACTPAPCADQSAFNLTFAAHVPPGDPSGFGGVPYTLKLTGTVRFLDSTPNVSNGSVTTLTRLNLGDVATADPDIDVQCAGGCFDYTIDSVTSPTAAIVLPLAGGVPNNPIWRILDNGTWRNFDTSTGDSVKSAPFAAGAGNMVCPAAGDAAYRALTPGDQCVQLSITDDGPNDLDPTTGTISDPGGLGSGGTAGGGTVFTDTRTSSNSGCTLAPTPVTPGQRADWWLLAGLIGLLGWIRKRCQH